MLRFVNNTFFVHNYFTNPVKNHQENPFDNFKKLVKEYLHMEKLKVYKKISFPTSTFVFHPLVSIYAPKTISFEKIRKTFIDFFEK
jgi:hypothetical protein